MQEINQAGKRGDGRLWNTVRGDRSIQLRVDALKAQEFCGMSSEGLWIELGRFLTLGRVFDTYARGCELHPQHLLTKPGVTIQH